LGMCSFEIFPRVQTSCTRYTIGRNILTFQGECGKIIDVVRRKLCCLRVYSGNVSSLYLLRMSRAMRTKLILTIFVVSLIVSGCSKKQAPAATPKEAVSKFFEGILEYDKGKFMGSVTGTETELKAASVFIDYMIAVRDFKQAVIGKYGTSGWAHFENEGGAKLSLNMTDNRDKLDYLNVEIDGDKAVCTIPGEAKALNLLRKNGVWYMKVSDVVTTGGVGLEKFIGTWTKMAELIKDKQQRIGKTGVTAQSLDMELGNEMMPILMGNR